MTGADDASAHDRATHDLPDAAALTRLVDAATTARRPGTPRRVGSDAAEPVDALWRTAQELYAVLTTLTPDEWQRPTATGYGTVHDVVAHLVGIERYTVRAVRDRATAAAGQDVDHGRLTRSVIDELRELPGHDLADLWFDEVSLTCEVCRADTDDGPVDVHGISVPPTLAVVFRAFEVWAHAEDVCAATGRPLPRLDGPRMGLLASTLLSVLPLFFTEPDATQRGRYARVVLVGPGGGVADLSLDPAAPLDGEPAARFIADIVDFCRVASRRLPIDRLERQESGATALLQPILTAAAAFAMD